MLRLRRALPPGTASVPAGPHSPPPGGRRGFTPESIRDFCERIGVAKANSTVDVTLLEHCLREDLNPQVPRVMCVLRPLKLVIENYPEGQVEELDAPFYPHDVPKEGSRRVPFSRVLYIEKDDFAESPPKGFHRLAPGKEVRLRYAYLVRCESVAKDPATGEILEVRCTYVSADHALPVGVRLYDRLFKVERPDLEEGGFETTLNPGSLEILTDSRIEPAALDPALGDRLQFERQGYFFRDPVDSSPDHPVFNRIVPLRDSWAQEVQKPAVAPKAPEPKTPKAPKEAEVKVPEPLTAEELEQLEWMSPELQPIIQSVLAAHPTEVERYRSGKTGILGFLVAQVMKQAGAGGKASTKQVNVMLTRELGAFTNPVRSLKLA